MIAVTGGTAVRCPTCNAHGPVCPTFDQAIAEWNNREPNADLLGKQEAGAEVKPASVSIPLDLAENLRDYLYDLIGERDWWKHERRGNYQRDYQSMADDIEKVSNIIKERK